MKKKFVKLMPLLLVTLFYISTYLALPTYASDDSICSNPHVSQEVKKASGCGGNANDLPDMITNIVTAIIGVAGLVAVVFIIIGGVQYITSSGDAGKVKKAKDTILYACIGLIICALSFVIVNFVIRDIIN